MSRHRAALVVVLAGLVGSAGAGCSETDPDAPDVDPHFADYCAAVTAEQRPLAEALGGAGTTGLLAALPSFERLRAEAPDDIADEWTTVVTRLQALADALADAEVDPASYDPDDPPSGVTGDQRLAITAAATTLASPATSNALASVQQQARDVCKTPLTLG